MQRLWMASDFIARPGMFPFCEHIRSGIFLLILSGYIVIILLSLYNNCLLYTSGLGEDAVDLLRSRQRLLKEKT